MAHWIDLEIDRDDLALRPAVESLLAHAGFEIDFRVRPLSGGANNRVFHLRSGDSDVLLKVYFRYAGDPRDRLGAEFAFCQFGSAHGIGAVPRPLACEPGAAVALYEYIPGRLLTATEVDAALISRAFDFYDAINRHRDVPAARALPHASEACFSLAAHLRCVDARVARLSSMQVSSEIDATAHDFVRDEMTPIWHDVRRRAEAGVSVAHLEARIAASDERLSPSDFGFHNAIMTTEGILRFVDFEYAGWDDPARLVCDFFCQPALPVPLKHFDSVVSRVTSELSEPDQHVHRIGLLFPVNQIRWCCILLNDFLGLGRCRSRFLAGEDDLDSRKRAQLNKARTALSGLLER